MSVPAVAFPASVEDRKILRQMSLVAVFFGMIVTKELVFPKVILMLGLAVGAIALFFQALKKPELVTYVFVVYLPFSRVLAGDLGGLAQAFNLTNVLMIFIVVVWLQGKYMDDESKWLGSALNKPLLIFMFLGLISIIRGTQHYSVSLFAIITEYKRWFTPFFLYFLVLNTVKKRNMVHNCFKLMMVVPAIIGLMAMYDYLNASGSSIEKMRIGGICDQPNQLAGFFVFYMFLPYALFLLNMQKRNYWALLIPFLIEFRGIMVTFSRGGYLGFTAGLFGITWFRSKILFVLLCLASVFVYFHPEVLPAGVRYRMLSTIESDAAQGDGLSEENLEASSQNRVEIWKGSWIMIQDHPMWGVGYSLFEDNIQYYWSGRYKIDAHNQYIIIAAEMGIPALIVFLLILFMMWFNAFRLYNTTRDAFAKAMALGVMGGLCGLLMNNMFGSRLNSQEVASYLFIMAALVVRLMILDKKEPVTDAADPSKEAAPVRRPTLDGCWFEPEVKP